MSETQRPPADPYRARGDASTELDDPGLAQALILLGWIPPGVAALISGVIVGFSTGSLGALVLVVIGGTVVGFIASLALLFTLGHQLELLRVPGWVAKAFIVLDVAVGIVAALAIAVLVSNPSA